MMAPFVFFLFAASPTYPSLTSTCDADGKVTSNSSETDKGAEVRTPLQPEQGAGKAYDRDDIDSVNHNEGPAGE